MRNILLLFGLLGFILFSCEKESANDKDTINDSKNLLTKTSIDNPFEYAESNLNFIAKGLTGLVNNQSFKNILYDKIEEQFDGDYNVLFKDLVTECVNNNIDVIHQMKIYLQYIGEDSCRLDTALHAFDNIDGHHYYIQIFIPSFEDRENFTANSPVCISYNGNEEFTTFSGYSIDENERLTIINSIDEDYSETNEVWVVSLNENVDDNGIPITPLNSSKKGDFEVESPSSPINGSTVNMKIDKMTVKDHKEAWTAGKSDVALRAFITYGDGMDDDYNKYQQFVVGRTSDRGELLMQFKRKWIKDQTEKELNIKIANQWENGDYIKDRIIYGWAVFERDVWPTTVKLLPNDIVLGAQFFGIPYRSSDICYAYGYFTSMPGFDNYYFDGYLVDLSAIKFNVKEI